MSRCACRQLEPHHLVSHLILKPEVRKTSLSWSPVTESNRRPSPYHRDPLKAPARHFAARPGQTLCFSSVGTGSGRFAPDAASQIPPNRWRRRSPCPTPVSPSPTVALTWLFTESVVPVPNAIL